MLLTHTLPDTIDLLRLHSSHPERYPYLLQSVARENSQARFDILFAFPGETLRLTPDAISGDVDFLKQLDACWQEQQLSDETVSELPFRGGWFLYLGYELAGQVEPTLSLPTANDGLPVAFAARIPAAVIVDHLRQQTLLVAEPQQENLLAEILEDLNSLPVWNPCSHVSVSIEEDTPSRFIKGVKQIKQYIVDGDVFQVNLSRNWKGKLNIPAASADIYHSLRAQNPGAFSGIAVIDGAAIISSSPERLVRVCNGIAETRPIAGTRPRGIGDEQDHALQSELLAHPKERAEHIMLIDLERNDLGRICVPGTVIVDELMALESYAHVHHIVSNVRGELREAVTPGEVIRAVFPGGTITGCPKVRCMEIIAEQEGEGRGAYTGSMGYLNHNGDMDLNILIRTIVQKSVQRQGETISLRAGAGIVADSIPEKELEETRAKAKGLLLALCVSGSDK